MSITRCPDTSDNERRIRVVPVGVCVREGNLCAPSLLLPPLSSLSLSSLSKEALMGAGSPACFKPFHII